MAKSASRAEVHDESALFSPIFSLPISPTLSPRIL